MAAHLILPGARRKEAGMRDRIKDILCALLLVAVIAFIIVCGRMAAKRQAAIDRLIEADTVRVVERDTIPFVMPAPVAVAPLPDVVKRLPRWTPPANKTAQRDSALIAAVDMRANADSALDSVAVIVPMERKVYTDSANYRAVISGAWVALDTIEVYPRREIVTIKQPPDNRRWGVSLMAGYGWAGKWTPFVGVGVSCTLFRF